MGSFFKVLGSIYVLFAFAVLIAGIVSCSMNFLHIYVFAVTGITMVKGGKYVSSFTSKFLLAFLILASIGIFLAGFFDGDPRFGNPLLILRYALVVLIMLTALILPVFANSFAANAKLSILYKALSVVLFYALSAAWFYEIYHEKGSVYFYWALLLLIPAYLLTHAINKLLTVMHSAYIIKPNNNL